MSRRFAWPLLWALLAALAHPAPAAELPDLYEAEVAVADTGEAARTAALGQALRAVVVKVSGREEAAEHPLVAEAAAAPGRFVQQFRYLGGAAPGEPPRLWARFDPTVVDALVRDAGLPLWGRIRPAVIAWLAVERDGRRDLLGADDPSGLASIVLEAAKRRGLPLMLPLLDLEDRARVRPADVWAAFGEKVEAASARYAAEGMLVGAVAPLGPGLWEARVALRLPDGEQRWTVRADLPELVLEQTVAELADRLASRYAGVVGYGGPVRVPVAVLDVGGLTGYARVLGYLQGLDVVSRVEVRRLTGGELDLEVEARGGADALRQVVGLDTVLAVLPIGGDAGELTLRLRR